MHLIDCWSLPIIFNITSNYKGYIVKFIVFLILYVGLKDLATPAHFISSPRPTSRRKKCPRIILFSANWNHGRRKQHTLKDSLPGRPNKRTNIVGQLWEHGGGAISGKAVTSALNARSWWFGYINEEMIPE